MLTLRQCLVPPFRQPTIDRDNSSTTPNTYTDDVIFTDAAAAYNSVANGTSCPFLTRRLSLSSRPCSAQIWREPNQRSFAQYRPRSPECPRPARKDQCRVLQPGRLSSDSHEPRSDRPAFDTLPLILFRAPFMEQSSYVPPGGPAFSQSASGRMITLC